MKLSELHLRDPYILPFFGKYYLVFSPGNCAWKGSDGFYVTSSKDLEEWSEPVKVFTPPEGFWANDNFWAPEMHYYKGAFYIFATFGAKAGHKRAVQVLKANHPEGPFEVWSEPLTPCYLNCIDGTLYVEDNIPYLVYSQEVLDSPDRIGSIWYVQLSDDLKTPVGEPKLLFRGTAPKWSEKKWEYVKDDPLTAWVAEGPFFHKTEDGKLLMLWASHSGPGNYVEAVAYSETGSLFGDWKQCETLLVDTNGGHGMLFTGYDFKLRFTMHSPNLPFGEERAVIYKVEQIPEEPFLKLV